jgi:hypothetical protein
VAVGVHSKAHLFTPTTTGGNGLSSVGGCRYTATVAYFISPHPPHLVLEQQVQLIEGGLVVEQGADELGLRPQGETAMKGVGHREEQGRDGLLPYSG